MKEKRKRGLTIRLGPLGLSLLAAGITAVGFAAVSLADSGGNGSGDTQGNVRQTLAPPPGAGGVMMFRSDLSGADRQKLEDFRKCMEDNGAPGPPAHVDPSQGPPKPPSAEERQKIQKAYEACRDKLPEGMQNASPPGLGTFRCGPPPGAPQQGQQQGQSQDQSNRSGTGSSGSSS